MNFWHTMFSKRGTYCWTLLQKVLKFSTLIPHPSCSNTYSSKLHAYLPNMVDSRFTFSSSMHILHCFNKTLPHPKTIFPLLPPFQPKSLPPLLPTHISPTSINLYPTPPPITHEEIKSCMQLFTVLRKRGTNLSLSQWLIMVILPIDSRHWTYYRSRVQFIQQKKKPPLRKQAQSLHNCISTIPFYTN